MPASSLNSTSRVVMVGAESEHPTWAAWHQALEAAFRGDGDEARRRLTAIVSPDVTFNAPAYTKTRRGQRFVVEALMGASAFFKDFRYTREIVTKRDMVLEFEAKAGAQGPDAPIIQGADFITLGEDGKITHLHVLARPIKSVQLLTEHQTRFLADLLKEQAGAGAKPKL